MRTVFQKPEDVIQLAQRWVTTHLGNALVREVVLNRVPAAMSLAFYVELGQQYEDARDQHDRAGEDAQVLKFESMLAGVVLRLQEAGSAPSS